MRMRRINVITAREKMAILYYVDSLRSISSHTCWPRGPKKIQQCIRYELENDWKSVAKLLAKVRFHCCLDD